MNFATCSTQSLGCVAAKTGYSFTFDTADPVALNLANADFLLQGYRYDLTKLNLAPVSSQATPQVQALYHASTLVDHLWIQHDPGTDQIVGSWPGS